MKTIRWLVVLAFSPLAFAAELRVRVVDVGAGECVVVTIPGDHYVLYDAGNWKDRGKTAIDAIHSLVPLGSFIDLMVLSHSDSDHLGAVDKVMADYHVRRVIHSGVIRPSDTWARANNAISAERDFDGCSELNLADSEFPFGATYRYGDAIVMMVAGFHLPPDAWGLTDDAERMNAGSIVIRVIYGGKSILICGDTVGRHIGDPPDACMGAEKFMVDGAATVPIDSDVIIAPHHGGDNGNSLRFIRAVSPRYVVFSSGHEYKHPTEAAAKRYLSMGVWRSRIYRTDRGDDEGGGEWASGRIPGTVDKPGDDDVEIRISDRGRISVRYRNQPTLEQAPK